MKEVCKLSLIFVHGLGQNSESWNETIKKLDNTEKVLCVDLMSLVHKSESTYKELYKRFVEYCNSIEGELSIVGLSLGGVLALNYAIEYPNKVKTLVLIASQYKMPTKLLKVQNLIFKLMPNRVFTSMKMSKKDVIKLTKSMLELNFEKELYKIKAHTLVICGEKDKFNIKASKKLKEEIVNSDFIIIDEAKHEVNTEQPDKLAKVINEFIK